MKSGKEKKDSNLTKIAPSPAAPNVQGMKKEFKWMGFKSHMMATMSQWREMDYLTDTIFKCVIMIDDLIINCTF